MFSARNVLFALATAFTASAHMEMSQPPPFTGKTNEYNTVTNYDLTSPMSAGTFPCNVANFDSFVSTSAATAVDTWAAGSEQSFTIVGGAPHNGGSCQAVLSEDNGKTWKVIQNYVGNCPLAGTYSFTLPSSAKAGKSIFGWTWFNRTGNREMYMNCAAINVTGGGSGVTGPDMFVANVEGVSSCVTKEGVDIDFTECGGNGGVTGSTGSGSDSTGSGSGSTDSGSDSTGSGSEESTETSVSTPTATAAPEGDYTETGDDAAATEPSAPTPTPAPIYKPAPGGSADSGSSDSGSSNSGSSNSGSPNYGSNAGTQKKYDDGMWRPGSNSGKYDDGMWRPSSNSGKYDNGMWSPEKYGKVKRDFKIRGLGRGIFGGSA